MKGNNEMTLCGAAMIDAVQHYLDAHVLKHPGSVVVTEVQQQGSGREFRVLLEEGKVKHPVTGVAAPFPRD